MLEALAAHILTNAAGDFLAALAFVVLYASKQRAYRAAVFVASILAHVLTRQAPVRIARGGYHAIQKSDLDKLATMKTALPTTGKPVSVTPAPPRGPSGTVNTPYAPAPRVRCAGCQSLRPKGEVCANCHTYTVVPTSDPYAQQSPPGPPGPSGPLIASGSQGAFGPQGPGAITGQTRRSPFVGKVNLFPRQYVDINGIRLNNNTDAPATFTFDAIGILTGIDAAPASAIPTPTPRLDSIVEGALPTIAPPRRT